MKKIVRYILLLFVATLLVGCSAEKRAKRLQEKIAIEAIEGISGSLSSGWVITLRMRNDTGYAPTINGAVTEIYFDNSPTVRVELTNPVHLPKKRTCIIDVPLKVEVVNTLKALSLAIRAKNNSFDNMDIACEADIEIIGVKRHISTGKVAVKSLLEKLDYTIKL